MKNVFKIIASCNYDLHYCLIYIFTSKTYILSLLELNLEKSLRTVIITNIIIYINYYCVLY